MKPPLCSNPRCSDCQNGDQPHLHSEELWRDRAHAHFMSQMSYAHNRAEARRRLTGIVWVAVIIIAGAYLFSR